MEVVNKHNIKFFITKDTAQIREILSPSNSSLRHQSLAEAKLAPGRITEEHYHKEVEETYLVTRGRGVMTVAGESRDVKAGDGIAIMPGQRHRMKNTGDGDLVFLCFCTPAYSHEDTILV